MPRYPIGVTLTSEERTRAGLPAHGSSPGTPVSNLQLSVLLPDGTECQVTYLRRGSQIHSFTFAEPLGRETVFDGRLNGSLTSVTEKARALVNDAFRAAMKQEQEKMRRKSLPPGAEHPTPEIQVETAQKLAGCYAVCVRQASGKLWAVGQAFPHPDQPITDLQEGEHSHLQLFGEQRLVIGICCRYLRRWIEPRFLPLKRSENGRDTTTAATG